MDGEEETRRRIERELKTAELNSLMSIARKPTRAAPFPENHAAWFHDIEGVSKRLAKRRSVLRLAAALD
jgi:lysophospholipase L1-like esterase